MSITVVDTAAIGSDAVGQIIAAVSVHDRAMADALHTGHERRPYAVRRDDGALRVAWFADDPARAFVLGSIALGNPPARIRQLTVHDALRGPDISMPVILFRSPCQFRAGRAHGAPNSAGRRDALFPDPSRVLGDLLAKWRDHKWPTINDPNVNRIGGQIERYTIVRWQIGRGQWAHGFTGAATYDLTPLSPCDRSTVLALLRFGVFRGVGAHTTYGMGAIDVEQSSSRMQNHDF